MKKPRSSIPLVVVLAVVISTRASADPSHPKDFIPGGRAMMMGGAYTAIANDASGVFHNPGLLALATRNEITANTTAFYARSLRYKDALNGKDFVKKSEGNFPSFIGSVHKFGILTAGYGIVTSDYRDTKQNDFFPDIADRDDFAKSYSRMHQENSSMQLYGGALGLRLGSVGIGFSSFYYRQDTETVLHQLVEFGNGSLGSIAQSQTAQSNGVLLIFGCGISRPTFALGFTAKEGQELDETVTLTQDDLAYDATTEKGARSHITVDNTAEDYRFPASYAVGLAIFFGKAVTIASEVTYHDAAPHQENAVADFVPTLNGALGIEGKVSSHIVLRGGIMTNNDLTRPVESGTVNQQDHIDYRGVSFGFAITTKDSETSFGILRQIGRGKAQIVFGVADVQDVYAASSAAIVNFDYYL